MERTPQLNVKVKLHSLCSTHGVMRRECCVSHAKCFCKGIAFLLRRIKSVHGFLLCINCRVKIGLQSLLLYPVTLKRCNELIEQGNLVFELRFKCGDKIRICNEVAHRCRERQLHLIMRVTRITQAHSWLRARRFGNHVCDQGARLTL